MREDVYFFKYWYWQKASTAGQLETYGFCERKADL